MRPSFCQKPIHTGVSCERHPGLPAEGLVPRGLALGLCPYT
jgi:hypothetical protein